MGVGLSPLPPPYLPPPAPLSPSSLLERRALRARRIFLFPPPSLLSSPLPPPAPLLPPPSPSSPPSLLPCPPPHNMDRRVWNRYVANCRSILTGQTADLALKVDWNVDGRTAGVIHRVFPRIESPPPPENRARGRMATGALNGMEKVCQDRIFPCPYFIVSIDLPPGRKNDTGLVFLFFLYRNFVKRIVQTINRIFLRSTLTLKKGEILYILFRPVEWTGGDFSPGPIIRG